MGLMSSTNYYTDPITNRVYNYDPSTYDPSSENLAPEFVPGIFQIGDKTIFQGDRTNEGRIFELPSVGYAANAPTVGAKGIGDLVIAGKGRFVNTTGRTAEQGATGSDWEWIPEQTYTQFMQQNPGAQWTDYTEQYGRGQGGKAFSKNVYDSLDSALVANKLIVPISRPSSGNGLMDNLANFATGGAYGAISGNGSPVFGEMSQSMLSGGLADAIHAADEGSWAQGLDRAVDPGGSVDLSLREVGSNLGDARPYVNGVLTAVGNYYGPLTAMAASGINNKLNGGDYDDGFKNAAIAGAARYIAGQAGEYISGDPSPAVEAGTDYTSYTMQPSQGLMDGTAGLAGEGSGYTYNLAGDSLSLAGNNSGLAVDSSLYPGFNAAYNTNIGYSAAPTQPTLLDGSLNLSGSSSPNINYGALVKAGLGLLSGNQAQPSATGGQPFTPQGFATPQASAQLPKPTAQLQPFKPAENDVIPWQRYAIAPKRDFNTAYLDNYFKSDGSEFAPSSSKKANNMNIGWQAYA